MLSVFRRRDTFCILAVAGCLLAFNAAVLLVPFSYVCGLIGMVGGQLVMSNDDDWEVG